MSNLNRHPIGRWRTKYQLGAVVETGCWRGDGVLSALRAGYPEVRTIDVDPEAFRRMGKRVQSHLGASFLLSVHTHLGDSAVAVPDILEADLLPPAVLWWLDAHYPEAYTEAEGTTLPLVAEVEAIVDAGRKHDVLVADDLRIYGALGSAGPLPTRSAGNNGRPKVKLEAGSRDELEYVVDLLRPTHRVKFDRHDTVCMVALPLEPLK